jgi:hypothetical protein
MQERLHGLLSVHPLLTGGQRGVVRLSLVIQRRAPEGLRHAHHQLHSDTVAG